MKKLLVTVVAVCVMLTGTLNVSAAGLEDVFSAQYYSDQYADLKAAFGTDEAKLFQHFLNYGAKEGRSMSPVFDVVYYRERYEDLDKAFGDNWDAYVEHYFTYGVNEDRDNGTDFDPKLYLESYGDLQAAFGENYEKVVEHYLEFGINEERTEGLQSTQIAREEENDSDEEIGSGEESSPDEGPGFEEGPFEYQYEYDEQGRVSKRIMFLDGEIFGYETVAYNEAGKESYLESYMFFQGTYMLLGKTYLTYNENGVISQSRQESPGCVTVTAFENGKRVSETATYHDGSTEVTRYDASGKRISKVERDSSGNLEVSYEWEYANGLKETTTYADGRTEVLEYDAYGYEVSLIKRDSSGNLEGAWEWEYVNGEKVKEIYKTEDGSGHMEEYDADGKVTKRTTYGSGRVLTGYVENVYEGDILIKENGYDAQGELTYWKNHEYEDGKEVRITEYDANGNVTGWTVKTYFEDDGRIHTVFVYDADGRVISGTEYA